MSIQNAINSMLSSVERGAALYAYSPMVEEAKKAQKEARRLDLEGETERATEKIQKEATAALEKGDLQEKEKKYWEGAGQAAQWEKEGAQQNQIDLLKNRYMRTGDPEDLEAYLTKLTDVHGWKDFGSIEQAVQKGQGAADARRIKEETGFTPEEWEALAMQQDAADDYGNEWAKLADERAAKQIIAARSQKADFEAHKEQLRRKSYKHTRYQGRMGGDR